jgi:hypothetical protein
MGQPERGPGIGTCEVCATVTVVNQNGECPGCEPADPDEQVHQAETVADLYDRLPPGVWVDLPQFGVRVKAWGQRQ